MRITVYLDDGLGSARDFARCEAPSLFVKTSVRFSFLVSCPMTVNRFGNQLLL